MNPRRYPLRAITLSVVMMHAAALAWIDTAPAKPVHQIASGSKHRSMQTRLAQATAPVSTTPSTATQQAAAEPTAPAATPAAKAPTEPPADTLATAADNAQAPHEAPPVEPTTEDMGDSYLPRPLLTSAPQPMAPVLMPFPAQITEPGRYATILALFIDEGGVVRRVRIDGPALPKLMEEAAKATFLQTHFRPGEVQGQQVKSLIRIEVVFDNTPTDTRPASRSL